MIDLYSLEAWDEAKAATAPLGIESASLTTCIRFLMADTKNGGIPRTVTRYCLQSMLRSLLIRSTLYHAAVAFRPKKLYSYASVGQKAFLEMFTTEEIAYLLGIFVVYRRIKKFAPPQGFLPLERKAFFAGAAGGLIGDAIPAIGLARGLALGTLPFLGSAIFLINDAQNFSSYRREAIRKGMELDPLEEARLWGTSYMHLTASLMQRCGLGVDSATAIVRGLLPSITPLEECPDELYRIRITLVWIRSLLDSGKPPSMRRQGKYYPKKEELINLAARSAALNSGGDEFRWLDITEGMISPESTPALFMKESGTIAPSELSDEEVKVIDSAVPTLGRDT